MKLKNYKSINFYADSVDNKVIYAEYSIPSIDGKSPNREKLVRIDSQEFESYIRMIVYPKTNGKKKPAKMLEEMPLRGANARLRIISVSGVDSLYRENSV